jgi:DNA-binding HxlR family transcriptional regulator
MPASELGSVLTLRHGSTGMKFELSGRQEEQLSSLQLARLFSRHFAYARGSVGAALGSWVGHIEKVRDGVLTTRAPNIPVRDALDELRGPWRALLLQLALHRRLTLARLRRVVQQPVPELERDLDALVRSGLVTHSREGVFEINPFVHEIVLSHFELRELLPT